MQFKPSGGRFSVGAALVSFALVAGSAHAAITGGSASFSQLSGSAIPASVASNSINIDGKLFGFDESIITLASDLTVAGGRIAAGTRVSSHLVFFDPLTKNNTVTGFVTFDQSILGFVASTGGIGATNSLFGLSGITYGSSGSFGMEGTDRIALDAGNNHQLNLSLGERQNNPVGDYVRVFTLAPTVTAVPEPSTYAMFGAGLLCVGLLTRRRLG